MNASQAASGFRFRVDPRLFESLPEACFGVVLARGIDNLTPLPEVASALDAEVAKRAGALAGTTVKQSPLVEPYREAFRSLGINPNKYLCSIEALLTRVAKSGALPHINTVVDLGNTVSIRHAVPIGAHDVATTEGELAVRHATHDDRFVPFGATDAEPVDADEVVYAAGTSVRTRRWTWRQSEQGKITADTTDVLFPIDGFQDTNADAVRAAQEDLADALTALGASVQLGWVDARHPVADLEG